MKAIVYTKSSLELHEVEKPVPHGNEVLVRIVAVSINAADYRSMRMGMIPKRRIYGADIAGRIEAVGDSASQFKVGDSVFGDLADWGFGGFTEYVAVQEEALALMPPGLSFENAACLPIAGLTALQALRDKGGIRSGYQVLIYGAGGGVGNFAVQLAKYYGAEVTAVCGPNNVELMRTLGADKVIDYSRNDCFGHDQQYDLILGVNGKRPLGVYKRALTRHGIFVMVGGNLSQIAQSLLFGGMMSLGSRKLRFLAAKPNRADLAFLAGLVKEGKLKPVIEKRYPLEQTPEGMQYASQGHARGKVIINVIPV